MELVSRKVEYAPLSPSTRVERRDLGDPPPPHRPRWNAGSSKGKTPGALPGGNSLLSLKSYYRKLRTFKGTIKALINLRRFSGGKKTDAQALEDIAALANDSRRWAFCELVGASDDTMDDKLALLARATKVVTRITADSASLDALQGQVHSLVNDGWASISPIPVPPILTWLHWIHDWADMLSLKSTGARPKTFPTDNKAIWNITLRSECEVLTPTNESVNSLLGSNC
jgi:hypothetical protein